MSCKVKTKYGTEVRLENGSRSILFEKVKSILGDNDRAITAYDKIKTLEHSSYDRNGEPNFSFGGSGYIDDVLLTLAVNGVKFQDIVTYRNNYKLRTGNDINKNALGVADAANNIIAYANGDVSTMNEEAIHLVTSAIENTSTYKRAKSLVNRDMNPELWDKYSEVYKDENKVRKEIVDKKLLEYMSNPQPTNRFLRTLQEILNKIKELFNKKGLKAELAEITKLITNPDLEIEEISNSELQYNLELGDFTKSMQGYQKAIESFIDKAEASLRKNESVSTDKLVRELKAQIDNKRHDLSMIRLVNNAYEKVVQSRERIKELKAMGNVNTAEVAKHLLKLKDTFSIYDDFIDNVQQIGITDPRLEEEMDKVAAELKKYRNEYITTRRQLLGHVLLPYFKKNEKYKTVEDLQDLFDEAEELHYWDNMLSSMADSNDDLLQVIDQYVKKALDKIEVQSFKEIKKLYALAENISTSNFDRFFQLVDSRIGTYLLSNKKSEQYYHNMNKVFSDLRQSFNLDSNKKTRDRQFDIYTDEGKEYAKVLLNLHDKKELPFEVDDNFVSSKQPMADILSLARKAYKAEQAKWFEANSMAKIDFDKEIEKKFKSVMDTYLYADLKKYTDKVINHYKKSTGTLDKQTFAYAINESFPSVVDKIFKDSDILPDQKEDIVNALSIYHSWFSNNMRTNYKNEYYATYDLSEPNRSYDDESYNLLTKADKKFLDYLHELKQKNLQMRTIFPLELVPQMEKGMQERLESGDPKAILRGLKEAVVINESDTEFGQVVDDQKYIPIYFNTPAEDMSRDLVTVFATYLTHANHHIEMSKIEASLALSLDSAQERTIVKKGSNFFGEPSKVELGKGGKNATRLEAYFDSVVYNKTQADDDFIPKPMVKAINKFQQFVSLNSLGFNVFSGIANIFTSTANRYQERIAERQFREVSKEAYKRADKFYGNYIKGVFDAYQNPATKNKAFILSQYLGIMDDFYQDLVKNDLGKNKALNKLSGLPYSLNTLGEHFAAHKTGLAHAFNMKLTKDGKEVTLVDAIMDSIQEDGQVVFKGYSKDGKAFTELDVKSFGRRINKINQGLFGIYNQVDKSQMQRYALGRLVGQFRKFVVPNINRRWQKRRFDYQLGEYVEGMYRSTKNIVLSSWAEGNYFALLRLTEKEKQRLLEENPLAYKNLIRTRVELASIVGALMLGAILTKMAEDDEDNALLAFLAYQANRHYKEMSFSLDPRSALDILKSPAAAVNQMDSMMNFLKAFTPLDGVTGGDFLKRYNDGTDDTYLERATLRQVPFYKTINRALDPQKEFNFTK